MDNLDLKIAGRYQLLRKLGRGGFGVVYEGLDLETKVEVAIKLEDIRIDPSVLTAEIEIYTSLLGLAGVPRIYWHGSECDFNVAVLELLGPNLEDLFNYCNRQFSLKTTLMLADQLISRLQTLHSKGVIHRDIKPENFLMGRGRSGNIVHITDFGLALDRVHRTHTNTVALIGTARFASITGHLGAEQSSYDDLTSLGYMLIYFLNGHLPWQGLRATAPEERESMILRKKQDIKGPELCQGLPEEFNRFFESICSPEKRPVPDYRLLRRLFRNAFRALGYEYDNVFDWTVLKFQANSGYKSWRADIGLGQEE